MSREIKDLFTTDWEAELIAGETVERSEGRDKFRVVLLAGLQRLAREAGIVGQNCVIQTPGETMVQAIFTSRFIVHNDDNTHHVVDFVGTADCNKNNTSGKFASYPTAVAESRAEARCLRKALGIRMLSSEEVGFREGFSEIEASPTGKADTQLVKAIQTLCDSRKIDIVQVLEEVIEGDRASTIFELSELTTEEAQRAMSWLNGQKPHKKEMTAQEKRDARKKELQS